MSAEKFWNRIAPKYAKSPIKDVEGYEKTLDDTKQYLNKEMTVLELGCGTGTTALKLAGSVKHLYATDISSEMIAIAQDKAKEAGCGNVTFLEATLDEGIEKGPYDAVIAMNLVHLLEEPEAALKQIHRLLKPGGVFISKTACLSDGGWFMPMVYSLMGKVMGVPYLHKFTAERFSALITAAGFELLDTHVYEKGFTRIFTVAKA